MTPPGEGSEGTVLAFSGHFLRRSACALGIHMVHEYPFPARAGPPSIRYCIWCGESDDKRWSWVGTDHRFDLGGSMSLIRYREAVP